MPKYILFSAVGITDPISNNKDGPVLHICRIYKPEKIFLFFSKEMFDLHNRDDRYHRTIMQLASTMDNFHPEIYNIVKDEIADVHKFDTFYSIFEDEIQRIHDCYPEYTILSNISSGTPAMKNAINLIATFKGDYCQVVQVSSPEEPINNKKDQTYQYDVIAEWEKNQDNFQSSFSHRASLSNNTMLLTRIKKEIIKKHISVYDYHAAFTIVKEIKPNICIEGIRLIEAATHRIQLNMENFDMINSELQLALVSKASIDERNLLEYLLWLQMKQNRKDYADFIRGITPAVADLFEMILKKYTGIKLCDFCVKGSGTNATYKICKQYLNSTSVGREYLSIFDKSKEIKGTLNNGPYSSIHAYILIKHYCRDSKPELVSIMTKIRGVESKVRNLAAHEIVSITDEWISIRCGYNSYEIMDMLKKLYVSISTSQDDNIWNAYDEMNTVIEEYLMKGK